MLVTYYRLLPAVAVDESNDSLAAHDVSIRSSTSISGHLQNRVSVPAPASAAGDGVCVFVRVCARTREEAVPLSD